MNTTNRKRRHLVTAVSLALVLAAPFPSRAEASQLRFYDLPMVDAKALGPNTPIAERRMYGRCPSEAAGESASLNDTSWPNFAAASTQSPFPPRPTPSPRYVLPIPCHIAMAAPVGSLRIVNMP